MISLLSFLTAMFKAMPGMTRVFKAIEGYRNEQVAKRRRIDKDQSVRDSILRVQSRKAGKLDKADGENGLSDSGGSGS